MKAKYPANILKSEASWTYLKSYYYGSTSQKDHWAFWMPAQLQIQWESLSQGNKTESDRRTPDIFYWSLHPHGHTGMCTAPITPIPHKSLCTYSHSKNTITKTSVKYNMQFSHICTYMSINAYMYTCTHIIYTCKSSMESVLRDDSVISHISTYYLKYSICCKTCY